MAGKKQQEMAALSPAVDKYVDSLAAFQRAAGLLPKDTQLTALLLAWRRVPLLQISPVTVVQMLQEIRPVAANVYQRRYSRPSIIAIQDLLLLGETLPDGKLLLPAERLLQAGFLKSNGELVDWLLAAHCIEFGQQPQASSLRTA